jgi:hypothetical protein
MSDNQKRRYRQTGMNSAAATTDSAVTNVDVKNGAMMQPQCLACGRPEQIIWVHGHGQCAHCQTNIMPCCDGAVCDKSA